MCRRVGYCSRGVYRGSTSRRYRVPPTSSPPSVDIFFSSRRRHTRLQGDWSSDVCSSDLAPGPGMLYVLARTLAGGKREGILSALGTFLGGMAHVFAAAAGISVILAKSASAFATVKYAGAAYLCYLGIRMILDAQKQDASLSKEFSPQGTFPRRSAFWQGGKNGRASC